MVLISQTNFEKLNFENFSLSIPSLVGKKIVFEKFFLPTREGIKGEKCSNFNFSKVVWDINTKFSPVVNLNRYPLCTKYEGSRCLQIWISRQKCLKLLMDLAGPFFELHPPNLMRIHFFYSCKNAEILVMISLVVSDLAKSVWSAPSISWGVPGLIEIFENCTDQYV